MKVRASCADVQAAWLSVMYFRGEQFIHCTVTLVNHI